MRKLLIVVVLTLAIGFAGLSTGYALTQLYKQVAGIGNVEFVNEVAVLDVAVTGLDRIRVRLQSNPSTEAGYNYTVALYLDGIPVASQTVSWDAPQIPGGVKVLTFSGLSLGSVTQFGVEVRR